MGIILDIFSLSGKTPDEKDRLILIAVDLK